MNNATETKPKHSFSWSALKCFVMRIQKTFCLCDWRKFKVGGYPLVAKYCPKCGSLKVGNAVYYDGSVYQRKLKGNDAIEYVKERIEYVESWCYFPYEAMCKELQVERVAAMEKHKIKVLQKYESSDEYKRILNAIEGVA